MTTATTAPRPLVSLPALLPVAPVQKQTTARADRGQASWFNAPDGTCAHRSLPVGTVVLVTRAYDGATARCTVDQWGPADTSRVIDLSMDTFEKLASPEAGLIEVVLQW